jgi:hypothetical protein
MEKSGALSPIFKRSERSGLHPARKKTRLNQKTKVVYRNGAADIFVKAIIDSRQNHS